MGRGVLALPAGLTVMRFLPPLVITQEELARRGLKRI
jgi:acetylornithine/succinyldiaminopimelate/putrescine aminotransferase